MFKFGVVPCSIGVLLTIEGGFPRFTLCTLFDSYMFQENVPVLGSFNLEAYYKYYKSERVPLEVSRKL